MGGLLDPIGLQPHVLQGGVVRCHTKRPKVVRQGILLFEGSHGIKLAARPVP